MYSKLAETSVSEENKLLSQQLFVKTNSRNHTLPVPFLITFCYLRLKMPYFKFVFSSGSEYSAS